MLECTDRVISDYQLLTIDMCSAYNDVDVADDITDSTVDD